MIGKTILLVEDNPDDEKLTLLALQRGGIMNKVFVVRDGEEALDYLFCRGLYISRDRMLMPQVVLLDLKLPKLNGIEVLEQIRANESTKRLPVVMLTSSKEDQDLARSYDNGVNSFVVKPVDLNEFSETVQQLVIYWLGVNEAAETAVD